MTAMAIERPSRRGACPGLSAPMPTGDGLLVRLLPVGTISLVAFRALCAAARQHGNGVIEITSRGSIQVRGLTVASAAHFADAVAALGIAVADGIPVLCNALAGLDAEEILDAGMYAANLREALTRTSLGARLAPKVSVAIDGGGALTLDGIAADIHLRAEPIDGRATMLRVTLGGGNGTEAVPLGAVAPEFGIEATMRLLEVLAQRGSTVRARDVLAADGVGPFRAALNHLPVSITPPRLNGNERMVEPIGAHKLHNGLLAYGVGLPYGHADAAMLERLARITTGAGADGIRAAPGQALMIVGLTRGRLSAFVAASDRLGLILYANDPRRHVIACAGAPICSSGHIAARAIAPRVAELAAQYVSEDFQIHISGCAKGCAHAGKSALTIVGSSNGCGVVANGSVRDHPFTTVTPAKLPLAMAQYAARARHENRRV
jgi:precorrin-3B synthase